MSIAALSASLYVATGDYLIGARGIDNLKGLSLYAECPEDFQIRNWLHLLCLYNYRNYNIKYGTSGFLRRRHVRHLVGVSDTISLGQCFVNLRCMNYQIEMYENQPAMQLLDKTLNEMERLSGISGITDTSRLGGWIWEDARAEKVYSQLVR